MQSPYFIFTNLFQIDVLIEVDAQGAMMLRLSLFAILLFASWVDISSGDCRVLADCDGGRAQWTNLTRGSPGRPGKRGASGAIGPKGEPGVGVNITEFKNAMKGDQHDTTGPQLYYYISSLTWYTGKSFCSRFDRTLCTHDQLCPLNGSQRSLIQDVLTGDHWVPILDNVNKWVEIGDHNVVPCILHSTKWGPPSWGTTTVSRPYKGYVYCCKVQASTSATAPEIKYQYIGKSATYESSRDHCKNQGRRLCFVSEACKLNKPVLGSVKGNKWVAVQDRFNEWVQIGSDNGLTCRTHGALHGRPSWGVRQDGSERDYVGHVYCCKITDEAEG